MCLYYIHLLFQISFYISGFNAMPMEPSCSSFEFEKKMLENTVRMEYEYKLSNEKVTKELKYLLDEKEKFIKEITEAHQRQTLDFSEKRKTMDAIFENQQASIQRLAQDFHEMKKETIKEIIGISRSRDISFRASLSKQISVSPGKTIVYRDVRLNHGSGYDPSTGQFTAPVNGTYMFVVRVCSQRSLNIVINIVVDGNIYSRSHNHDDSENNCYSYSDVTALEKGMGVWVNCGAGSASAINLYSNAPYHQNIFAGYLL